MREDSSDYRRLFSIDPQSFWYANVSNNHYSSVYQKAVELENNYPQFYRLVR